MVGRMEKWCRGALMCTLLAVSAWVAAQPAHVHSAKPVPVASGVNYPGVLRLHVDAADLDHRIFRIQQTVPVAPGALTLHYPRFLPGTHGPYGEIERLAGLHIEARGQRIAWQRDTVDPYSFHVEVPAGVSELKLTFQFLSEVRGQAGRVVMTREMLNLQWISTVLYPAGFEAGRIPVQASVTLPEGWQLASALRVSERQGDTWHFEKASLERLADSPIFAGRHHKQIALDPQGTPKPVVLNLFADAPEQLQASDEQIDAHRQLVQQTDRLMGSRHFRHYDFLLSLSERMGGIGLEHHESSENGVRPDYFKNWGKSVGARELLPHEYVHSWNGKFRRPADLWTPHYNEPMRNSLLWLYEGQTQYWGRVLAARSGLVTPEQTRELMARTAAESSYRAGKLWRNLQDTTNEGTMRSGRNAVWRDWQRGSDYYEESSLIWLDADTLIREKSQGKRSLDDFAKLFFGAEPERLEPLTYTFDDIVSTLNRVQPHDWSAFLRKRLDSHELTAPLDGLRRAGWRLDWSETESEAARNSGGRERNDDFAYSLGLLLRPDGQVQQVRWSSPAFEAGMSPALQLVAVQGISYKAERLAAAITANKEGKAPLQLLVKDGERYRTLTIDYRQGLRYPKLVRIEGVPEGLDEGVLKPRP
jgi:predicted metalloprotease with PDZ domain